MGLKGLLALLNLTKRSMISESHAAGQLIFVPHERTRIMQYDARPVCLIVGGEER
jgi:hypothetical protein